MGLQSAENAAIRQQKHLEQAHLPADDNLVLKPALFSPWPNQSTDWQPAGCQQRSKGFESASQLAHSEINASQAILITG